MVGFPSHTYQSLQRPWDGALLAFLNERQQRYTSSLLPARELREEYREEGARKKDSLTLCMKAW